MKLNTRKLIFTLCILLCLALPLCACLMLKENNFLSASAEDFEEDLHFTLYNDSTEYKVSALNKNLKEANIPARYNGLPVTEIADNAFTNCTELTKVFIPYTVVRIGNNAFANCRNLSKISGMPCLEAIGNNAFAMCVNLNNLILPSSIKTLGNTILRNNPNKVYSRLSSLAMLNLNSSWNSSRTSTAETYYGNQLVYEEVYDDDGNLVSYELLECQNLAEEKEDLKIYDYYNGLPVINIREYAFYFNQFNSISILHDEHESSSHTMNICNGAFYGVDADRIEVNVNITLEDSDTFDNTYINNENGTAIEVFALSTVRSILLPNSLDRITRSMFSGCENLREILSTDPQLEPNHLSENIVEIDTTAFEGCTSMISLYIPKSVSIHRRQKQ